MNRIGSRREVMNGTAKMTGGGLNKTNLKYNKFGKIVSKKMSVIAKKNNRLQEAGFYNIKGRFGSFKMNAGANAEDGQYWNNDNYVPPPVIPQPRKNQGSINDWDAPMNPPHRDITIPTQSTHAPVPPHHITQPFNTPELARGISGYLTPKNSASLKLSGVTGNQNKKKATLRRNIDFLKTMRHNLNTEMNNIIEKRSPAKKKHRSNITQINKEIRNLNTEFKKLNMPE
jgi:hypothetical protein